MVSALLRVPEPLDDWLAEAGPLDELDPCWDWDRAWDGDRVDWVWFWDDSRSAGTSSDILQSGETSDGQENGSEPGRGGGSPLNPRAAILCLGSANHFGKMSMNVASD